MNRVSEKPSIPKRASVPPDDQTLISQCRAGDQGAFKELVQRYQRKVYGIAFGMLHSSEDAMDVTQDVFIKIHKYLDRFQGTSSFYTWMYRMVVNLCIDHLRKEGRAKIVDYDDSLAHDENGEGGFQLSSSWDTNPGKVLARKEISSMIHGALQQLSPNHRAVLLMREVDGLSYSEMAEIMRCTRGTIMSRLFHARKQMQQSLLQTLGEKDLTAD